MKILLSPQNINTITREGTQALVVIEVVVVLEEEGSRNSKPMCQVCNKTRHISLNCFYKFNKEFEANTKDQNTTNAYITSLSTVSDSAWYLNSGASDHVTKDDNQIENPDTNIGKKRLVVGNGNKLEIRSVGNTILLCNNDTILPSLYY